MEGKMPNHCVVCNATCQTSCAYCKKTWYCSVDHQKSHRKEHKKECFPAIERQSLELGHYFIATRDIKPLEIIWAEKPIMTVPDGTLAALNILPMCLGCCVILPGTFHEEFPHCPSCKWPLCSTSCKDIHWHLDYECQLFQQENVKPVDLSYNKLLYEAIKVLRIILLKRRNSVKWTKINSLKSDIDWLKPTELFGHISTYLVDFIGSHCKLNEEPELINAIYGIVNRNSNRMFTDDTILPGRKFCSAMYEKTKKLLHSCRQNTVTTSSNDHTKKVTYSTTHIKPGEILYDLFTFDDLNFLPGHVERRSQLFEDHQLWCKCSTCLDPNEQGTFYSAIKCNKKHNGELCPGYLLPCIVEVPENIFQVIQGAWKCNSSECKVMENYHNLQKIINPIKLEIDALGIDSLVESLTLIKKLENIIFHENHCLLTRIRFSILPNLLWSFGKLCKETSLNNDQLVTGGEKLKSFAFKCLEIANKLQPGHTLLRGVILYFIISENYFRVKYNLPNALQTADINRLCEEALSILKLATKGTYGNTLYEQLQTENVTNKIYVYGYSNPLIV